MRLPLIKLITLIVSVATILSFDVRYVAAMTDTYVLSETVVISDMAHVQATVTPILTSTETLTATLPYTSLEDIKNTLVKDIGEVKGLLLGIDQRIESKSAFQTSLDSIRDNLIGSFIWQIFGDPIVASLMTLLGSLSVGFKVILNRKPSQESSKEGISNQAKENITSILNVITVLSFTYPAISVLLLFYISAGGLSQAYDLRDSTHITERLDRIESQLQILSATTNPTPTIEETQSDKPLYSPPSSNINETNTYGNYFPIIIFLGTTVLLIVLLIMIIVFFYRRRTIDLSENNTQPILQQSLDLTDRSLLNALLLALIFLVLPYPVDTFILPFILQYFMLAFFDIVRLYPSQYLKQLVIKRYSILIFLAVCGAWLNFGDTIQSFLYPFWYTNRDALYRYDLNGVSRTWSIWLDLIWEMVPLLIAVLATVPQWRHIRELSKGKAIPKIIESLNESP